MNLTRRSLLLQLVAAPLAGAARAALSREKPPLSLDTAPPGLYRLPHVERHEYWYDILRNQSYRNVLVQRIARVRKDPPSEIVGCPSYIRSDGRQVVLAWARIPEPATDGWSALLSLRSREIEYLHP